MTFGGVGGGLRITLSLDIGVGGGEGKESVSVSGVLLVGLVWSEDDEGGG